MSLRNPKAGPASMFAKDKPPSRGQYETLATLALQVLELQHPSSRYEASVHIARLQAAIDQGSTSP